MKQHEADPPIKESNPEKISTNDLKLKLRIDLASSLNQKQFDSVDFSKNLELTSQSRSNKAVDSNASIPIDLNTVIQQNLGLSVSIENDAESKNSGRGGEKKESTPKEDTQNPPKDKLPVIALYQIWPGNNRFYFNGKLIAGPKCDRIANALAWILILGIGITFFAIAFPYLWKNVTKILPIISIYLYISTIVCLILTSYTEPGIIPRKEIFEINGEVPDPYNGKSVQNVPQERDEILIDDDFEKKEDKNQLKFCKTCQIYRPPRSSHCKYKIKQA